MSRDRNQRSCLDAETLAAFAEGKLTRQEIAPVLAHLRHCNDCTADVEAIRSPASRRLPLQLLAAAAVLAIAIAGLLLFRDRLSQRDPIRRLVSLSPRSERLIEPRVTGGFPWTPFRGPMRATEGAIDPEQMKLVGAAGEILDQAAHDPSASAQQGAGLALLLTGRPKDAVEKLRAAAEASPNDAKVRSDLAAARLAAAERGRAPSLIPMALADVDAALRIDPRLPEARFNRALILERLGLLQAAREAWQQYLELDASSKWAEEARQHLARLPATTGESQFRSERPRLERAVAAGDVATISSIVQQFRQQSRAFGEGEYLGFWGEAALHADAAEASRQLTIARAIGDALLRISGESLLRDAVRAIDDAAPERRREIAEAHVAYRRGRIAYSRQAPAEAESELRRAAQLFANDPMALVARYYAANTRFDRGDIRGARTELEALLHERRFPALAAHVRWELALCLMNDDDWSGALPLVRDAARAFCDLGESSNCGFLETLQADVLNALGRPDDAWAARIRSFTMLSTSGRGDRLPVSLGGAVQVELRNGQLAVARSLAQLERAAQSRTANDVMSTNTLVRAAVLDAQLGDPRAAAVAAREAAQRAAKISDAGLRARALTDVDFATGAALLADDPRRAAEFLGKAIDGYRTLEAAPFIAECHLLRARARLRVEDRIGARRDLDDGIAAYERQPVRFSDAVSGTGVLDAGSALYREAIELALARGDHDAAFAYADRSLAQIGPATPPATRLALQERLADSGNALLELVVLPHEVIAFCITSDRMEVHRQPVAEETLPALADAAVQGDRNASTSLYDLLIRPAAPLLARANEVIVIADPRLARVPFAALTDSVTRRMFVEQMPLSVAPSASALRAETQRRTPRSMLGVELASEDVGLPGSVEELAEIRRLYASGADLAGERSTLPVFLERARNADVIHLSGHSANDAIAETVLLLGPAERRDRVSWRRLSGASLRHAPVVVLAACDTLRAPHAGPTRALSLGGAFLAAGAGDVIGTLTPVADSDARLFFLTVHRHLAAGAGAAEAVRRAQLESMRDPHRTAWRSVAVLTTRIRRL
ncbi:MAG TPA: CHAT domain-containing protein [Thermoanaerobaculia bacterium]|nr:CHAT domain-containing protein [Thermoanaerobaculia bacterium]